MSEFKEGDVVVRNENTAGYSNNPSGTLGIVTSSTPHNSFGNTYYRVKWAGRHLVLSNADWMDKVELE